MSQDLAARIRACLNEGQPSSRDEAIYLDALAGVLDVVDKLATRRYQRWTALELYTLIATRLGIIEPLPEVSEWRPVCGFEGLYEVSDTGLVRRVAAGRGAVAGRLMALNRTRAGYDQIALHLPSGKRRRALVHRLVAEAFLPPPGPDQVQINHLDGNKVNNRVGNLEWATQSQNIRHAYDNGLIQPRAGELSGRRKLNWADVLAIRDSSKPAAELAEEFGVRRQSIYRIRTHKRWKNPLGHGPGDSVIAGGRHGV